MRSIFAALPLVLIAAGCQKAAEPASNNSVDINAAAEAAQGDIDTYAANSLQTADEAAATPPLPAPTETLPPLNPPGPGEPGGLPDDRTPISEAPFTPDSAQGAANVVQTYYALIGEHKYRQAWALWGDGGKASGMSAAAFAASFDKYSEYHANVGAPGRVDAGAGQRYVTVPVQAYGRLKAGAREFNLRGDVTLHRTADIDGATAAQKSWHINTDDLKPMGGSGTPAPGPIDSGPGDGTPATADAEYRCAGGLAFHVHFDNKADTGTIRMAGKQLAVLDAQRSGSGIWYKGGGYELRGKGKAANFTRPGKPTVACTAR